MIIHDPPALIIAQYLIDQEILSRESAQNSNWPVTVNAMPDDLDNKIVNRVSIHDTGGYKDGRITRGGENVIHPCFMITIRGGDYPTGWKRGQMIEDALSKANQNQVILANTNSYTIEAITLVTELTHVREDKNRRQLFTCDHRVSLQAADTNK